MVLLLAVLTHALRGFSLHTQRDSAKVGCWGVPPPCPNSCTMTNPGVGPSLWFQEPEEELRVLSDQAPSMLPVSAHDGHSQGPGPAAGDLRPATNPEFLHRR